MKELEDKILNNEVMKQVLADSFGGICYNHSNKGKYDSKELLDMWESLSERERNSINGIIKGAINFLKEEF